MVVTALKAPHPPTIRLIHIATTIFSILLVYVCGPLQSIQ